jgi:hypothetical protein
VVTRPHRREEQEAARAGALGRAHEPQRGHRVELLDRGARLVADRGRQVHHSADAAQGVAKRRRVGQVPQRDLHPHALLAEPARVANEAAHRLARGDQAAQQRRPDRARGPREQDHRPVTTIRHSDRTLRCTSTSSKPASSSQPRTSEGAKLRLWLQA